MTDEELAAIEERIVQRPLIWLEDLKDDEEARERVRQAFRDRRTLLDEVEHSREIVRAVAEGPLSYIEQPEGWTCAFCDASTPSEWGEHAYSNEDEDARAKRVIEHTADCPVTKARAILGQ